MTADLLLKIAGPLAAVLSLFSGSGQASRIRSALNADADLITRLPECAARTRLTANLDNLAERLERAELDDFDRRRDETQIVLLATMTVGFGYWSWTLFARDDRWQYAWIVTGIVTLAAALALIKELRGKPETKAAAPAAPKEGEGGQVGLEGASADPADNLDAVTHPVHTTPRNAVKR